MEGERGPVRRLREPFIMPQVGMFKVHPEIPESMSAEAKAFILKCFEPDPDKRACANDLLIDEFLKVSSKKKKTQPKLSGMLLQKRDVCELNRWWFKPPTVFHTMLY